MKKFLPLISTLLAAAILSSCGGGGSSPSTSLSAPTLASGTVAVGAPISGASVTARDGLGNTSNTVTANERGEYSGLDLSGLSGPIIIEATGQLGQTSFKLSTPMASAASGTANVTSLTTTLSAMLAGGDPTQLTTGSITAAQLATAKQKLAEIVAPVVSTIQAPSSADPISTAFVADNTGADKLLDALDIRYRGGAIIMSNRLEKVQEGQTESDLTSVTVSVTSGAAPSASGALPPGANIDTSWLSQMASALEACFALAPSERVTFANDVAGVPIASAMNATCGRAMDSRYLQNSYDFKQRWVYALKDATFNNTKFKIQLRYVVGDAFGVGDDAYVVNVHFKDAEGNGYTRPEVVRKVGADFKLYGNQRQAEAYVEPVITQISEFENGSSSGNRIEGRLRMVLTPHRIVTAGVGEFKYNGSNKADPQYVCAWVTGLGLPGDGVLGGDGKPRGGILIKVPRSDYVARQDYMAVHVKFPDSFNPEGVLDDRKLLLKACAAREWNGTAYEVATWNTNNQFTIDSAKINASGTFTWPTSTGLTWAGTSNSYSGTGTSHRTGTYRVNPVPEATKAAYRPTVMPVYTFYAFKRSDLPAGGADMPNVGSVYTDTSYSGSRAIPIIPNTPAGQTMTDNFFSSAQIIKARMAGAMPYLETNASGVYIGNSRFSSITPTKAQTFLGADAPAIVSGGALDLSWIVPSGSTGVDRVGYSCWANWSNSGNEVRWGPSSSSNSWGVPRSVTSRVFTLEEECEGLSARALSGSVISVNKYREVWTRSYDEENRQIQGVTYAKR